MAPGIGRIVHYTLSHDDVEQVSRRRTSADAIRQRMPSKEWPQGAQAHIGYPAYVGQILPMLVVNSTLTGVNGQVFLDGNDVLWKTALEESPDGAPGYYHWPSRD